MPLNSTEKAPDTATLDTKPSGIHQTALAPGRSSQGITGGRKS